MTPLAPPPPPPGPLTPGPSQPRTISPLGAVRFVFEGPDWKNNMLLGSVLMLIPIAGPICFCGWMAEAHQRLVRRHPQPLPKFDFSDFGHYLSRGVMVFLVNLVMTLPFLMVFYALLIGVVFGAIAIGAATDEPLAAVAVGGVAGLFTFLIMIAVSSVMNAAMTRAELTEDFGKSLNFGPMLGYARSTFARFFVKQLVFGLIGAGIILLGALACYIGMYPALFVLQAASMHLRWQLYDDHVGRGGEPIELKPPQWLPSELARMGRG